MSKKVSPETNNQDLILGAFQDAKEQQLDLLDDIYEQATPTPQPEEQKVVLMMPDLTDQVEIVETDEEEDNTVWHKGAEGDDYTDEEWHSPVAKNGPPRYEVEAWKEKHGEVFFTPFSNQPFIWRKLTRPEYREIIRDVTLTALDREELFTEKCVLFPRNYTLETIRKDSAGVPSLLSEMIMEKSGFVAQSAPIKL